MIETIQAGHNVARELDQSQQDFRLLVDGIQDYGIFKLDPAGLVLTWNSGAQRLTAHSSSEILGQPFSVFFPPEDCAVGKPARALETALEVGRFEDEGWRVRKDGTRFWANMVITGLRDAAGVLRGFGTVTQNLTDRRTAEERLRRSEERYRVLVESVQDYAIILLDTQGQVATWNAGAERVTGWTAQEAVGESFERFHPAEDVAAGKPRLELESATLHGSVEDYGWRMRKDGTRFWASVVLTAVRNPQGVLLGFSKVTRDATQRRNSEEALRKAYEELEAFSYSVSHDLRAPLRSMDGFSDELCVMYDNKLDDRGRDYLKRIRDSSQRMGKLIDELLNLARIARAPLQRQPVNLSQVARTITEELHRLEPARNVEVTIAPDLLVSADATLMRTVLENLIGNAWKYTSHHAAAHIAFGATLEHGRTVYFVRDDGAGFDMAYKDQLFGAFRRLHPAGQFSGNGIGLATVKKIIHHHGGDVGVTAAPKRGATFTFTLGTEQSS